MKLVILQIIDTNVSMKHECKPVLQFTGGMMLAAIAAFLMHPLLWMTAGLKFDGGVVWAAVLYMLVYGVAGMWSRWKWWQFSWKKQALLLFVIINVFLAIVLNIYLRWPRYMEFDGVRERWYMDGMTGMLFILTSAVAALLSAIPISLCCYYFKRDR